MSSLGYEQITALTAAVGLTVPIGTAMITVTPEGQAVRWRDDGVDPTATVGHPIPAGETYQFIGNFGALRFIEQLATAKLNVTYGGTRGI